MKSISSIMVVIAILLSSTTSFSQIKNAKTETVKIDGNCGMCKTTIEKAGNLKKVSKVDWNKDTKMATITYNSKKTSSDEILKRIALAGYDSKEFLAPDEVYANLHGCCKYKRTFKPESKANEVGMQMKTENANNAAMHMDMSNKNDNANGMAMNMENTNGEMNMSTKKTNADGMAMNMGNSNGTMKMDMSSKDVKDGGMAMKMDKTSTNSQTGSPLNAVINNYFSVKDALVKSDAATTSAKASELVKSIKGVDMAKLSADAHTTWMNVMNNITSNAENMASSNDVAKQRQSFALLSDDIYKLAKVSKQETTVYYQHCPMFNKGKGANWLSKEETIKNPYYGSQMVSCGSVKEVLNK